MKWIDLIKGYKPLNEQEEIDKKVIIKYSNIFNDMLTRDNEIIHITSSAFAINQQKNKALMVHHNIYNSWAWTGGHADGDADLLNVAIRELREETGVKNILPIYNEIISIDILPVFAHIKNGKYVSAHLHASIAFLIEADESDELTVKPDENSNVKWIPLEEIDIYSNESHMKKVYKKIISKIR